MMLTIEDALHQVGSTGRYQIATYIFFCLQWIIAGSILMSPIFIFEHPTFDCSLAGKGNLSSSECETWACSQPNPKQYIDDTGFESFVLSFDPPLICDDQWISDSVVALAYGGTVIGFLVSIYISDNFGRRITSIIFWTMAGVGCMIAGLFRSSIWGAAIGLSLANAGVNPTITIQFCFVNEHSDGRFREYTSASLNMYYSVGTLYLVLAYIFTSTWSQFIVFWIGIPTLAMSLFYYFIYEPPLYLISKDPQRTVDSLNKIAKRNGRPSISLENLIVDASVKSAKTIKHYGYSDIFRHKSTRVTILCASIAFFVTQITYYGANQSLSLIGLETKYNTLSVAISELLSTAFIVILIPKMRRKKWCIITTLLCSSVMICFFFVTKPSDCSGYCTETIIQIILMSFAKFVISFQISLMYVYFSELIPTTIRSLGLGFTQAVAQIGSSISGYTVTYFNSNGISPIGFMGLLCLSSSLLYVPLEETFQKPLLSEIKEVLDSRLSLGLELTATSMNLESPNE